MHVVSCWPDSRPVDEMLDGFSAFIDSENIATTHCGHSKVEKIFILGNCSRQASDWCGENNGYQWENMGSGICGRLFRLHNFLNIAIHLLPHAVNWVRFCFGDVTFFFVCVCVWNISGTVEWICAKFTRKTRLVPRLESEEFEGQGQKSKVKVTRDKNCIFGPFGGLRAVYVW